MVCGSSIFTSLSVKVNKVKLSLYYGGVESWEDVLPKSEVQSYIFETLRLRSLFVKTDRICQVWCNF